MFARLEGDVTEKGRDIILVQKKEVTEKKDGETEAGPSYRVPSCTLGCTSGLLA